MSSDENHLPVIVIAGPTASGKSAMAMDIAEEFDGWVINADSMQVYRDLRILTARPTIDDEARVPHKLFGFLASDDTCSAGRWLDMAADVIADARSQGKLPIVVGGTGMYLRVLMEGIADLPDIPATVRAEASDLYDTLGGEAFREELAKIDPDNASRLPASDRQRLIRAWEVVVHTGKTLGQWQRDAHKPSPVPGPFVPIALTPDRERLYTRINRRFDEMVDEGALDEVKALLALRLDESLTSMKAVGVREFRSVIQGESTLEEAVTKAKTASRQYAKRQLTWIRNQFSDIKCLSAQYSESFKGEIFSFIRQNLLTRHQ